MTNGEVTDPAAHSVETVRAKLRPRYGLLRSFAAR